MFEGEGWGWGGNRGSPAVGSRALHQCFMHPKGQFWCIFYDIGDMKCGPD